MSFTGAMIRSAANNQIQHDGFSPIRWIDRVPIAPQLLAEAESCDWGTLTGMGTLTERWELMIEERQQEVRKTDLDV